MLQAHQLGGKPRTPILENAVSQPRLYLSGLATSGLLWLSYFPADLGFLGWIALVPLLGFIRSQARPRQLFAASYLCGLAFFLPVIQWMRVADYRMYATWICLSIYCSFYFPIAIFILRRLDRSTKLPWAITVPLTWVALEMLRGHLGGGFPWYFLGHSQHSYLPLIQVSDLGGAYLVSFMMAACNGLVAQWLAGGISRPKLQAAWVAAAVALSAAYGFWQLSREASLPGPRVSLLQGNLDQRIRNEATANAENAIDLIGEHYFPLCDRAAAAQPAPDLIVWPETSYPGEWFELAPGVSLEQADGTWLRGLEICKGRLARLSERWGTSVLLGINANLIGVTEKTPRYNSAVLISPNGSQGGRYDKIHRVPFGEFVPLKDWLPFMNVLAPYDFDYSIQAGEQFTRFPLGHYKFGVIICYEDTDPSLARQYVAPGADPKVDFLVNISNDGWFDGTAEHEQHLAICRFRAIEARRAVARAVNMGISALIDGNGAIVALPSSSWQQSKKVSGIVTAQVPLDRRISLYAALGDWLPIGCWAILVGCWIRSRLLAWRR